MYDSFGLDKHDVHTSDYKESKLKWLLGRMGFIAWWVLQHVKGYKHLDTKIYNNETISGKINFGTDD